MNKYFQYLHLDSPISSDKWLSISKVERLELIELILVNSLFINEIKVLDTKDDGQVIVSLNKTISPHQRGTLLLDLEELLKDKLDNSITVWLEPLGDKNSLRNLRGIEVKFS
jgi:hypothetical protein